MSDQPDLGAIARAIVDGNLYMTLATVDEDGRPWATPVFYATADHRQFYWISSPEAQHSRNLARHAQHAQVGIVVFDSRVPASTGQAVYMQAVAERLEGAELARGLRVYPGPAERGGRAMTAAQLQPPATYRLYRATVSQHWVLCPWPSGPCPDHGLAGDHRAAVTL
jgi:uncharacterized protein YhbP (UPF0306 family)